MTETQTPRSRFYDGWLYARVMDPLLAGLHGFVADQVAGERVLDAGCGTGDLVFRVAPRVREAVGVELSPAMVDLARRRAEAEGVENVSFLLGDATEILADRAEDDFDVATMVLVLHELPPAVRVPLLQAVARVARRVLVVDFRVPMPWSVAGIRNRTVELLAGPEHFGAFRHFGRLGGTAAVADAAGLACEHVRHLDAGTMDVSWVSRP